jgi:ferritin-like protein
MMKASPVSRSTLLRLLTEACELEHGLACSYLYAAMTLRQEPAGNKLPPDKTLQVRQWASQVYFVASQEMLHLAQAWNLLIALGGTPYYLRPNFPQNTKYYPLHMRLALEPYGEASLARFIEYERPEEKPRAQDDDSAFRTIGVLYDIIERDIEALPGAIIGDPASQVGRDLIDFPDIVKVVDVESAKAAVHLVTHQGEGNAVDREDCHFGIFVRLLKDLKAEKQQNPEFAPAHAAMTNPATDISEEYGARHATLIQKAFARDVARLFDGLYSLMLRMLGYTFTPCGDSVFRRAFGQGAIVMMATVLKPLGEGLVQIPAAKGFTAGPPFGLTRHVTLPADPNSVRQVVSERLAELTATATRLASSPRAPVTLGRVATALHRLPQISKLN